LPSVLGIHSKFVSAKAVITRDICHFIEAFGVPIILIFDLLNSEIS